MLDDGWIDATEPSIEARSATRAPGASAARGSAVLLVAFMVVGLGNYAYSLLIARLLPLADYGVVALAQSFLLFAAWFTQAGFPLTATRRLARTGDSAQRAVVLRGTLRGNLVVAVLLGGVLLLLLGLGTLHLEGESATPLVLAAAACSLLGISSVAKGALQGLFRFSVVGLANTIETALKLGVGVGLAATGHGATGAVLGMLAGLAGSSLFALWSLRQIPVTRGRGFGGLTLIAESVPLFVGFAGVALLTTLDILAVKVLDPAVRSNTDTALYTGAVTLARLPLFLAAAMTAAVYPHIARAVHRPALAAVYVRTGVHYIVVLLTPISLAMMVAPEAVIGVFLKGDFTAAAPALRLLAAGTVLLSLSDFLINALQAGGGDRAPAVVTACATAVEVVLLAIGLWAAGSRGTAAALQATALAFDVACALCAAGLWLLALRRHPTRVHLLGVLAYLASCAAFCAVMASVPHDHLGGLMLASLLGLVAYSVVAVLTSLLSSRDLRTLMGALPGGQAKPLPTSLRLEDGIEVVGHLGDDALTSAAAVWDQLALQRCVSPFSRRAWAQAWWSVYGQGRRAVVLEVRRRGTPVGLAPLQITTVAVAGLRRVELLGGSPASWTQWLHHPNPLGLAYANDVVAVPGQESAVVAAVRAWLVAASDHWDSLRLCAVPEDGVLGPRLDGLTQGWARRGNAAEAQHIVDVDRGFTTFVAELGPRQRRHVRYEPGALAREAGGRLTVDELRGEQLPAAIEEFLQLNRRRWAVRGRPGVRGREAELYRRLGASDADLVVLRLRAGDRTVAMQLGWRDACRYTPYNFAFEPDVGRHSPSNVLLQLAIADCCAGPQSEVDLSGLVNGGVWTSRRRLHLTIEACRPERWPRLRSSAVDRLHRAGGMVQRSFALRLARALAHRARL